MYKKRNGSCLTKRTHSLFVKLIDLQCAAVHLAANLKTGSDSMIVFG